MSTAFMSTQRIVQRDYIIENRKIFKKNWIEKKDNLKIKHEKKQKKKTSHSSGEVIPMTQTGS